MKPADNGLPSVGPSARMLGVRLGEIAVDAVGLAVPGSGGMSVALGTPWHLPHHRRPSGMGRGSTGPAADRVYGTSDLALADVRLVARPDPRQPTRHAFVEP